MEKKFSHLSTVSIVYNDFNLLIKIFLFSLLIFAIIFFSPEKNIDDDVVNIVTSSCTHPGDRIQQKIINNPLYIRHIAHQIFLNIRY